MQWLINTTTKKLIPILVFTILVLLGVISFQQIQSELNIEGFIDPERKIAFRGGTVAGTQDQYFAIPIWHDNNVNKDEIDAYVNASDKAGNELVQQGNKRFYVGITFRRYVSPEEFVKFVEETGVSPKNYMLRATFPTIDSKVRVGMFGRASEGSVIDPQLLERAKNGLKHQARERKANKIAAARANPGSEDEDWHDVMSNDEFKAIEITDEDAVINGIYTFEAETNVAGYQKLRAHSLVYHVDVTATVVFQNLKQYGVKWANFADNVDLSDYDPFWDMENIGLDKFK